MKQLKQKVEKLTLKYIEIFPDEYRVIVNYLASEKEKNKDKFASVSQNKTLRRKSYEIPETLSKIFDKELTTEELVMMKDGQSGKDFAHWFAKRFPEFAGGTNI